MGVHSCENGVAQEPTIHSQSQSSHSQQSQSGIEDRTVPSGHYGNLTALQQAALDEMREKVAVMTLEQEQQQCQKAAAANGAAQKAAASTKADDEEHQRMLLRFLRARSFKVSDAFEMYAKDVEWRTRHQIDTFLEKPPKKLGLAHSCVPGAHHKCDKRGRPIRIEKMGQLLSSRVPELFSQEEYHMVHAWDMEMSIQQMRESSKRLKTDVETLVFIGDMSGLTMQARKAVWLVKAISAMDELHYPERCGVVYLINCPWVFPALYNNLVRPFLDPVVAQKVRVYDHCPTEELLEIIDADSLPKMYGGTCMCDGNDDCVPMPSEEAISAAVERMIPKDLAKHRISASRKVEVRVEVGEPAGAALEWYFRMGAKGGDIDFSATWHPTTSNGAKSPPSDAKSPPSPRSAALEEPSSPLPKKVLRKNRSCPDSLDIPEASKYSLASASLSSASSSNNTSSSSLLNGGGNGGGLHSRSASVGVPDVATPVPGVPFEVRVRESVRVDHLGARGEFLAQGAGTLVLRWDNTSRIYKKTVEVHVSQTDYMQKIEEMTH